MPPPSINPLNPQFSLAPATNLIINNYQIHHSSSIPAHGSNLQIFIINFKLLPPPSTHCLQPVLPCHSSLYLPAEMKRKDEKNEKKRNEREELELKRKEVEKEKNIKGKQRN
jgi:hypothetical protein